MRKKDSSAAPAEKKASSIEIDGKTYRLAYDFNKIVEVESEARCNLLHAVMDLGHLSARQLLGLLCAMIRAADPASKMTVAEAAKLVKYNNVFAITEAIAEAIVLSMPEMPAVEPVASA